MNSKQMCAHMHMHTHWKALYRRRHTALEHLLVGTGHWRGTVPSRAVTHCGNVMPGSYGMAHCTTFVQKETDGVEGGGIKMLTL